MKKNVFICTYSLVTVILICVLFYFIRVDWYPSFYYSLLDVSNRFYIFALSLIVVGPVFSAFIFKSEKKNLSNDLLVVALLHMATLLIGVHKLYSERPLFLVFSVDRFVVVAANSIDQHSISPLVMLDRVTANTPILVAAHLAKNTDITFVLEVLKGGPDIEFRPDLYEPIAYQLNQMQVKGSTWDEICVKFPHVEDNPMIKENNIDTRYILGYPLVNSKSRDHIILFDMDKLKPVLVIDVSPWALLKDS